MIDPNSNDIGRGVIYRRDSALPGETEAGVITSFNAHSVFVRYVGKRQSQGTSREDLTWEFGPKDRPMTEADYEDDDLAEDDLEHGFTQEDCGRWSNGRLTKSCGLAGTEDCDFECPLRGSLYT